MTRPVYVADSVAEELWAEYRALNVSDTARDAARQRLVERIDAARRDGVYERAREIAGTVEWSISWHDLRIEE